MRWTLAILLGTVMCVGGCGVEGVHSANPRTIVRVNPLSRTVELYNNKDVDVLVEGFEVDVPNQVARLEKLTIQDNASRVREVNPLQIDAVSRQAEIITAAVTRGIDALAAALGRISINAGGGSFSMTPTARDSPSSELADSLTQIEARLSALESRKDSEPVE